MRTLRLVIEKSNQKLWLEELVPPNALAPPIAMQFTQTAPSPIRNSLFNASRLQTIMITKFDDAKRKLKFLK